MTPHQLAELARRATPGKRIAVEDGRCGYVSSPDYRRGFPDTADDARFMAACDKETILALLAVVEAARAYRDARTGMHTNGRGHTQQLRETDGALKQALDALAAMGKSDE